VTERPRVGISRCLLGDEVRYDGGHKREPLIVESLGRDVEWVPVCPEVEAGMGVPREPINLLRVAEDVRLVGVETGRDWTERMRAWATQRMTELASLNLSGFVLKARSPSCGPRDVPIRSNEPEAGAGLFAATLMAVMPDLPIEDEERLRDTDAREQFLARVRRYARRAG
jgi:uncharacterized protein YbbK (DUF523 family)